MKEKRYTVEVYARRTGGYGRKLRGICVFSQVVAKDREDAKAAVMDALIGQRVGDYTDFWPIDPNHEPKVFDHRGSVWSIMNEDMKEHIINEYDFEEISIKARLEK